MGIYHKNDLRKISQHGLNKMVNIHTKDLGAYYISESYPSKQSDIDETIENIHILKSVIEEKEINR
ncbi:hypothetical protein B9T62_19040 [Paenibacillus donghaensis]|uniref:Uncharacterized protein n=1 Tax=Paenibacillus donghaensis TaxID=414771 RepID=A0A2Z2KHG9_9BACL|nr:hypothetical protein B9T62_19040 [Paenibacillus donghaensis]